MTNQRSDAGGEPTATESERLAALADYGILDTPAEREFDDLVRLAAEICDTPVALVTLLDRDRQWFKARIGTEITQTPIGLAFCKHALGRSEALVIPDLAADPRTRDNPLVTGEPHVRFYAGAPLATPGGQTLGTICVLDFAPRPGGLTLSQVSTLEALARQAMTQFELRRALARQRADDVRHRQVLDSAIDYAIISLDLDGFITGWNRGAEFVLGWSEAEIAGKPADVIFNESDRAVDMPGREMRIARERGRASDERWHVRRDGSRFFALGEMMPLHADDGRHVGYLKILRDRTRERRREQRLDLVAKASAALLATNDPAGELRPILEGAADALGIDQSYTYDIAPDRRHLTLTHSVGVDAAARAALRHVPFDVPLCGIVAETGRPLVLSGMQSGVEPRFAAARRAGLEAYAGFPVLVRGELRGVISFCSRGNKSFDDETLAFFETVVRFLSIVRQRTDDENALRESDERSRNAEEAAQIGTFELDIASDSLTVSPEFCRLYGLAVAPAYPAAAVEARIVPEDAAVGSDAERRRDGSARLDVEYRIRRADDNRLRWIARRAQFVRDGSGRAVRLFGAVYDVTERKLLQARQAALLELGDRLRQTASSADAAAVAARALGDALAVSRAGYVRINARENVVEVEDDWTAPGVASLKDDSDPAALAATLDRLARRETTVVSDAPASDGAGASGTMPARIQVPLIERGDLVGVLYAHQSEPRSWTADEIDFVEGVADRTHAALARIRADETREVLNRELAHRLKNTLAVVSSIVTQTLRTATDIPTARKALTDRIQALSRAHDILLAGRRDAGSIEKIVEAAAELHDEGGRMRFSGPELDVGPRAAMTLSLIVHELATNAGKYGALSAPGGRVDVAWSVDVDPQTRQPTLRFDWRETGGPPVVAPSRKGFGTRLIEMGVSGSVGGSVELTYAPDGLRCRILAPLTEMLAEDDA